MKRIEGYLAAPFTPMHENGEVNLDLIPEYAAYLIRNGLDGAFICGSTGEGALLTREERQAVAEKWIAGSEGKLKIVVHTGGISLKDQMVLAVHAERSGAFAIAAMAPAFLPPGRNEELLAYCKSVAGAAPSLPFYYYHIPPLNRVQLPVSALLSSAAKEIPSFAGVKFSSGDLDEFERCMQLSEGRFEMLWGRDDMFLDGLDYGIKSGVGGTYNHCFSLYRKMAVAYAGKEMKRCRQLQDQANQFCGILDKYRRNIIAGKSIMSYLGLDCGPNRLPLQTISDPEKKTIREELDRIGFFEYCNK
ncbi:MAG: dihydrodipicolinate synthase family protein [Bacteroidales bacterium]|nr:dihydrodipicolinate synthase family protein [Bacteroidales bacterium]